MRKFPIFYLLGKYNIILRGIYILIHLKWLLAILNIFICILRVRSYIILNSYIIKM